MTEREPHSAASRRAVSDLVRRFFADLTTQLTVGTTELWKKVEGLAQPRTEGEASGSSNEAESQRQPVQQQQAKAEPKKDD